MTELMLNKIEYIVPLVAAFYRTCLQYQKST